MPTTKFKLFFETEEPDIDLEMRVNWVRVALDLVVGEIII
jgi:hypothetical protein